MPISEKSSKIKFLEKFQKILYKFLCQKWGRETPGRHLASHLTLPPLLFLSPENNDTPSSNPSSCYSSPQFFDLLAQPNISAEIWSNCSPVCDSSTCPSRISFGEVFLSILAL
jgi:hypothetical protein